MADADHEDSSDDAGNDIVVPEISGLRLGADENDGPMPSERKKKQRKKKSKKKKASTSEMQAVGVDKPDVGPPAAQSAGTAPAGYISRLKHTKYISTYHIAVSCFCRPYKSGSPDSLPVHSHQGPWLQLPSELLQTLLLVNSGPTPGAPPNEDLGAAFGSRRRLRHTSEALAADQMLDYEGEMPPPVDPRCFRTVVAVRHLVEEASDLAVRATIAVGSSTTQDVGRRQLGMSSTRQNRLRLLAVSKLARAYGLDEIATSVVVMQSSSALEDVAEKVLRIDPNNPDGRYVGFYHEKILGRCGILQPFPRSSAMLMLAA